MDLVRQTEIELLKLENKALQAKIELKDQLITQLADRLDSSPARSKSSPESFPILSRSNSFPISPIAANKVLILPPPPPQNAIASGSQAESDVERQVRKKRLRDMELEILRLDATIIDGKRVKVEGELEDTVSNGKRKAVEREGGVIPEEEPLAPIPTPPAVEEEEEEEEVVALVIPRPRSVSPMEELVIAGADIQPIRLSSDIPGQPEYVSKGLQHHLSIGYSRKTKGAQCITIEKENEEGGKTIMLEFEPSDLFSVSHSEGRNLYMFAFRRGAENIWKALEKATNCPIPPEGTIPPVMTFIIPAEGDQWIEEMVEPFVLSTPYAAYNNLAIDVSVVEEKKYLASLRIH